MKLRKHFKTDRSIKQQDSKREMTINIAFKFLTFVVDKKARSIKEYSKSYGRNYYNKTYGYVEQFH